LSPASEEVRAQLARIIASPEFVAPERARGFLRYVVEETLAGHADRLKGYTIAVEVFERDESFDSQADPVVRIEAGRLRRALERYHLVAGRADPVLIEIPKGGYVPTFSYRAAPALDEPPAATTVTERPSASSFRWRALALVLAGLAAVVAVLVGIPQLRHAHQPGAVPEAAAVPEGATLLVMPFASLSEGDEAKLYAAGLTEEILTQLSRFKELTVLGRETTWSVPATADPGSITHGPAARYVLAGSLRVSGRQLRVASRLVEARTGAVLCAQTYGEDLRAEDLLSIQEDIARQVVATVALPYGVVFQADLQRTANQPPDDLEAYACTLRFYVYRAELSPEQHALVRTCLEEAVARFPSYATAWAMLSLVDLDEDRFAFNLEPGKPAPIERALVAARRAVELDAHSARALQALMMALFFHRDVEEAIGVGERALAANPSDSELLSEFGLRIAMTGQWQRGRALVEQAFARNPGHSGYYHAVLALIAYMQRDLDRAVAEIRRANLERFPIHHAVAAVIYAEGGLMAEAHQEAARLMELQPSFLANLDAELARRNLRPEDRARLVEGLHKAGLPVPRATALARPPKLS
jgi:adenylate cyclase